MKEKCVELSVSYLVRLLQKRNDVAAKKFPLLHAPRLLVLNRRVRKAIKLLRALSEV